MSVARLEEGAEAEGTGAGVRMAAAGEEGEVRVRGRQVFSGYWGDERATARALLVRAPQRNSHHS